MSSEASVTVRGPPRIVTGREVQWGSPGETVHIVCEATAVPRIQAFQWLFQVNNTECLEWKVHSKKYRVQTAEYRVLSEEYKVQITE